MRVITSLARIIVAVAAGLTAAIISAGLALRQPILGRTPLADGPRAEPARLRAHVESLTVDLSPRGWRQSAHLAATADYIAGELSATGGQVQRQAYSAGSTTQQNVVARFGVGGGPLVVVGAHYDAFGDLPGADDNASGVAGLLELGRLLGERGSPGPVELVAYATEEPPFFGSRAQMGSAVHAAALAQADVEVRAMLCLEMIGYFTDRQPHHSLVLDLLYPGNGRFVSIVGRWQDRDLARRVKRAFRGAGGLDVVSYSGPTRIGADLSDHRSYWAHGMPAVMVTDTAFLRNPNYHRDTDTAETLDYDSMAEVVDGVLGAVLALAVRSCDSTAAIRPAEAAAGR